MWTSKSYDAVFDWSRGGAERARARAIMLEDGLDDVVARLDKADNLAVWNRITYEAAKAVGPDVVEESAKQAEIELERST